MDITLYHTPQTRSVRPRWLLEELKIPYKIQPVDLFSGEGESVEYKKINPLGAVPSMKVDDEVMLESGAMCHWLTDKYGDMKLAPSSDDPARLKYEQWMMFAQATLEMQPWLILLHSKILPEAKRVNEILPWASQRHQSILKVLNDELQHNDYLLGDEFSTADIMIGSTLMMLPETLSKFPVLEAYVHKLKQRPAYQQANN